MLSYMKAVAVDTLDLEIIRKATKDLILAKTHKHAAMVDLFEHLATTELLDDPDEAGDPADPFTRRMLPLPTLELAQACADALNHAEYMGRDDKLAAAVTDDFDLTNADMAGRACDMWECITIIWKGVG